MNHAPQATVSGTNMSRRGAAGTLEEPAPPTRRSPAARLFLGICAALVCAGFLALGTWQLQRLQWKLDLIAHVNQRVHAPAVAAPGRDAWPRINASADEYRHVRATGTYLYPLTTRVQASTELGSGFWLITPLRNADGSIVLINRGFVYSRDEEAGNAQGAAAPGAATVTGLLRISEPGGAFLRHNDAAGNRWYSRDVQAIAAARNLPAGQVAPYFIDAQADSGLPNGGAVEGPGSAADRPIGGLTVIAFHNNHLVYAFTWYALALMVAGACFHVVREERKSQRARMEIEADADKGRVDRKSTDGGEN
ncbi:MAG: Cytochrome oxidase biosis protein Surf1, facilitates heme insertion [Herbaspirillum sp.]|jgi:surfeit locus 1 family protein|nr:Cytochrome oxidase biosis protein Surf1, facilitates heme insertion [Herbaspirillum sp.]